MPRIINTFSSSNPLAESIKAIGQAHFGDQLTPALKRQQLADSQREQFGIEGLARTFGAATDGAVNFNRAAESGVLAGLKPEDVAMFTNYLAGNITGPRSDLTTNAMAGAGKYGDSAENLDLNRSNALDMNAADNNTQRYGYDTTAATSRANNTDDNTQLWNQFLQKPIEAMVGDKPGFVQQGKAVKSGAAPILNENQIDPITLFRRQLPASELMFPGDPERARQHAIAQLSKTTSKGVTVFGPDGNPIVEVGGTDGGGGFAPTSATETQLQKTHINFDKFKSTINMARDVASANPDIFGIVGMGRQATQDAAEIAKSLGAVFGVKDIQGTLAGLEQDAAARGVDTNLFGAKYDPALGQIESLGKILAYTGASAIANQSGRDLSDKDVENVSMILGDPRDWAMNQQRFLTKLQQVEDYVNSQMAVNNKYLFGQPGSGIAPPAGTTPPPAANESWTIGPDGKPLRVQ